MPGRTALPNVPIDIEFGDDTLPRIATRDWLAATKITFASMLFLQDDILMRLCPLFDIAY